MRRLLAWLLRDLRRAMPYTFDPARTAEVITRVLAEEDL